MRRHQPRLLFITGTDTGVGKTVLTALLLVHLRKSGCRAIALKPFCSGTRADAKLLHALQEDDLRLEEVNPFYFPEPVAPLVAARKHRRKIALLDVLNHISRIANPLSQRSIDPALSVLIEGAGGLLAPLGEGYSALNLIARLRCGVIVAARNQLGTLNHTLLTLQALQHANTRSALPQVVLMNTRLRDDSCDSNPGLLAELLDPVPVFSVPFLGGNCFSPAAIRTNAARLCLTLSRLVAGRRDLTGRQ